MQPKPDLQIFHNDLRAAVRAGVELEIGDGPAPNSKLSIDRLEELEAQVANDLPVPERYQAAIETWQKTGSMVPILEGLSIRNKAWNRIGKLFRSAMFYILLVAILAIAAMIHYKLNILPEIEAVRLDLIRMARSDQEFSQSYAGIMSTVALLLFVVMLVVLVWAMFAGGITKAGLWVGGKAYMRCQALAVAARTTQLLIAGGVEPDAATKLGGSLAGLDPEGQGELLYTIKGLDQNELRSPALSDYLLMIADRQYSTARTWGPGVLIVIVGGFFTILYALLSYGPFASLLGDLSKIMRV